jgi:hypothetical protein
MSLIFMCVTQISHIQAVAQAPQQGHWSRAQVQASVDAVVAAQAPRPSTATPSAAMRPTRPAGSIRR